MEIEMEIEMEKKNYLEIQKDELFDLINKEPYQKEDILKFLQKNKQIIYEDNKDEILIKFLKEKKFYLVMSYIDIKKHQNIEIRIEDLLECFSIDYVYGDNFYELIDKSKKVLINKNSSLITALNYKLDHYIIEFFINNKTDINEKNKFGNTPLIIAIRKNQSENIIKLLINNKADVNKKDQYGITPLILAVIINYSENIIKLLINNKTDINQKDNYGITPLMYAIENKHSENIIKLLINNKTDINQKDNYGNTPLRYLFNYSEIEIRKIFYLFKNCSLSINDVLKNGFNKNKLDLIFELKPEFKKKNFFNWNYSDYLKWYNRKGNINYLLIFS